MTLLSLLALYKYPLLFPIGAIEGPIVSLAAGFLSRLGYFNFLIAYVVMIFSDIVPDLIYYSLGRYGNRKQLIERYGPKLNITPEHFGIVERIWRDHGRKTMFFGKLGYGITIPFLVSAGLARVPVWRFLSYTIPVTMLQYGVLMTIGYYFGQSYETIASYVEYAYIFIAIAVVVFISSTLLIARYARKQVDSIRESESEESVAK